MGGLPNLLLPDAELSIEDIRAIIPRSLIEQLHHIYMCGNYGDPMVARDTMEVFRYFRQASATVRLGMFTNGSGRDTEWWKQLATLINYCQFGLDGLEDTHHLYRRRTDWATVLRNAAAFIAAGGEAEWEFLVFRHNEHQVLEARELARSMGFARFRTRRTNRFFLHGRVTSQAPVHDSKGRFEYHLEAPLASEHQNPGLVQLTSLAKRGTRYEDHLDTTSIECLARAKKRVFLSAEGLVFPCPYLAHVYLAHQPSGAAQVLRLLESHGGTGALDGRRQSVRNIVEGRFFQRSVPDSWDLPGIAAGRLAVCADLCGSAETLSSQSTPSSL
jgi:MoaA/NifB/PqqE/SkfB family radical SAM enzyme